jgi:hypothetical protein
MSWFDFYYKYTERDLRYLDEVAKRKIPTDKPDYDETKEPPLEDSSGLPYQFVTLEEVKKRIVEKEKEMDVLKKVAFARAKRKKKAVEVAA